MSSADSPASVFSEVASKSGDTTWALFEWDKAASAISFVAKGKGALQELKDNFAPSKILFAVYKVQGVDDRENVVAIRDKLISIAWVGPSVSPLARNAVLASKPARTNLFQGCTTEFQIDDADRLTEREISRELLRSGGAHKPTYYKFADSKVNVSDLD